jgi:5-carboxymethyl-2-hydroxymuconate isomerase
MPHLILEYTSNLTSRANVADLLEAVHQMVGHTESVDIESLKSRSVERETFRVGADSLRSAFLFLRLEVLPGRSLAWKRDLGQRLLARLLKSVRDWAPEGIHCSTNVDLRELDAELYFRSPPKPELKSRST